ncbi:MAG: choice-of-anchor D domain-containing protein [Myxococcota bacterium]
MVASNHPRTALHLGLIASGLCLIVMSCGGAETTGADASDPWVIGAPTDAHPAAHPSPEDVGESDASRGCQPDCQLGQCGDDGCGGSCGPCSVLTPFCYAGWCQLDPPPAGPALALSPPLVDFGLVAISDMQERTLTLSSIGKEAVEVSRFGISGDGAFVVVQGDQGWRSTSGTEVVVELIEPWRLEPGEDREMTLRYAPIEASAGQATLRLISDDPSAPDGHTITLRGGPPVGCIEWSATSLDFGATVYGTKSAKPVTLTNCGTLPITIDSLSISGDNAGAFTLLETPPTSLAPGAVFESALRYEPTAGSVGALGTLEATVHWEGGEAVVSMTLTGFVVVEDCPVAVVSVAEETPVAPGTVLHLSGLDSYAPVSTIASHSWSVLEPQGSAGRFNPNTETATPTFAAMVAGKYQFNLSVIDDVGNVACVPASTVVRVAPTTALYVELTWVTPGDEDPTDQGLAVGTDLDLHVAHPNASGPDLDGDNEPEHWFDPVWDCYWFNPSPDWGPFQPPTDDDPHLTIEDIDGAGPEAITLDLPEIDVTYRIAVHSWQDHGMGPSVATVRVYLLGDKIFESQPVTLNALDLWEVAEITWHGWPDATVTPIAAVVGGPVIFPGATP